MYAIRSYYVKKVEFVNHTLTVFKHCLQGFPVLAFEICQLGQTSLNLLLASRLETDAAKLTAQLSSYNFV